MRKYEIFKIKSEYQSFIMGRERLLFELLAVGPSTNYQEIEYLCDQLNDMEIDQIIRLKLSKCFDKIDSHHNEYRLTHLIKGEVFIKLGTHCIEVYCQGSRMLDLDLFVALSTSTDRFFAVMNEQEECGWLKPVKYSDRMILENTMM
ncbi:sporulation inhibitor of replication protein SirA [Sporosarcina sp. GW1-11]|uniref:sporulation inhibitor of replication protein SirA n=1 Tax=Sporosarcina sp. GW1-11 TaxID=2899126 RepID=UPI00294CA132|nr:sporulation inhibitor of replication protein SirA [Sporosarcina sp. GW1-11]MDV6377591.1 sporulation inhibitor of replication protein SirA [Sporosarcina sp. GW1-11]